MGALIGLALALTGVGLFTCDAVWDDVCTADISVLLGAIAVILMRCTAC